MEREQGRRVLDGSICSASKTCVCVNQGEIKFERDVWRKCRHGEDRCMFVIERSLGDRDGTTWVGDRVTRCVRDRRCPE